MDTVGYEGHLGTDWELFVDQLLPTIPILNTYCIFPAQDIWFMFFKTISLELLAGRELQGSACAPAPHFGGPEPHTQRFLPLDFGDGRCCRLPF